MLFWGVYLKHSSSIVGKYIKNIVYKIHKELIIVLFQNKRHSFKKFSVTGGKKQEWGQKDQSILYSCMKLLVRIKMKKKNT